MKILLVSNYFLEHSGGIESVASDLAGQYRAAGHEVRWAAADVVPGSHRTAPDDVPLKAWNVTEESFGFPYPIPRPSEIGKLLAAVRWADVIHLHDALYAANVLAYSFAKWLGRPTLLTQHVGQVPYASRSLRALQSTAYRTIGRVLLSGAATVVFVSPLVRQEFGRSVKFRTPPQVITNGVDVAAFLPPTQAERQERRLALEVARDDVLLLFVGRFVAKKGLRQLREAAQDNPGRRWVLLGRPGDVDPHEWKLPNVRILPAVSRTAISAYYGAADLLVLPSTGEGFPVVVQEAAACGLPSLISADTLAASPEAADFVFSFRPSEESLSSAIDRTLSQSLSQLDTKRLVEFAERTWSVQVAASRYLCLLGDLATGRVSRRVG